MEILRPELTTSMMISTDTGGTDPNATDAENTGFGDFMAGTEVFGATTVNLGPNWTIVGETFDLTAGGATDTDLSTLPTAFTSTLLFQAL